MNVYINILILLTDICICPILIMHRQVYIKTTKNVEGFLNQLGVIDNAGCGVVHLVGGFSR